eukprot:jgi/Ulvmu1/3842/UM018_0057.1
MRLSGSDSDAREHLHVAVPRLSSPERSAGPDQHSGTFTKRSKGSPSAFATDPSALKAATGGTPGKPGTAPSALTKWHIFSRAAYMDAPAWELPWGWSTIVIGLIGWSAAELVCAVLTVATTLVLLYSGSTDGGQVGNPLITTAITLVFQGFLTALSISMVSLLGACHRDRMPDDWLRISPREPFQPPFGWAAWAAIGLCAAPVAAFAAALPGQLLPQRWTAGAPGTVQDISDAMRSGDLRVYTMLAFTEGVLAPVQEEITFRGFFMASLTRHMPMPAAAATTAAVFAICHFNAQDFLSLCGLGLVMGTAYGRSRNLLSSIAVHAGWNLGVLAYTFWELRQRQAVEAVHDVAAEIAGVAYT